MNLRALIREVADTSNSADPGVIAEAVAAQLPDTELRAAFTEMLRGFVRETLSANRSSIVATYTGKPGSRSWKREAIREHWSKVLRQPVHIGPASTDWKFLGDCGVDDLGFAAAERRRIAEANLAVADRFEALAKLLADHGATTVRDLPTDALDDLGEVQ